ncbi:MAG TPA: hypothetical protein VE990_02015 [Acidimicrobiales bacterium]|nr:hypothetical protein [Acidimicrobiales bacterium]
MAVALIVAAVVGVLWWAPWAGPTVGGLSLTPYRGPVPSFAVVDGYHIVYRVSGRGASVSTEQVWVKRPFDSLVEELSGPPPGRSVSVLTLHRLGDQIVRGGDASPAFIHVATALAAGDIRLDTVVAQALRSGLLLPVRRQVVAGRSCQVFRSADSLRSAGPLAALKAGSNYVDSCIDRDGLLLEEDRYADGGLSSSTVATAVEVGAGATAGADFALSAPLTPFSEGGGSFTYLTLSSSPPGRSWAVSYLPPGYQHVGRFAVVPSQPQVFTTPDTGPPSSSGLPNALVTELDDTFVDGPNLIALQQGSTIGGSTFPPPPSGESVQLGDLGTGQLVVTALGPIVTAEPGGTQFVRLIGSVPPDVLVQVARSLKVESPGTLTTIPGTAPPS